MARFNGKWRLVCSEHAEEYFNAIHASEEFKAQLRLVGAECKTNPDVYIEELHVDEAARTIQRIIFIKGEKKRDSGVVKFGVEFEKKSHGQEKASKIRVELEGDKIVRHEKGDDYTAVKTVEVHGDELVSKLTAGGVTATQKFKRV